MPPKKGKGRKRNSVVQIPKENGDVDSSLNSPAVETPMSENQEFITPADRPDNPLDKPVANGAAATDSIDNNKDAMAKAEGDEAAASWGLDDDKGKGIVGEPDAIPDTAEKLENGSVDHKPAEVNGEERKGEEHKGEEHKGEEHKGEEPQPEVPKDGEPEVDKTKDDEPKTGEGDPESKTEDLETKPEDPKTEEQETKSEEPKTEEQETKSEEPKTEENETKLEEPKTEEHETKPEEHKSEEPKEDIPTAKTEEQSNEEKKPIPPADLDIPDTADAKENATEDFAEKPVTVPVVDEHAGGKSLADELAAVEAVGEEEDETLAEKPAVEETEPGKVVKDEPNTETPTEVVPIEEQPTEEKNDEPAPRDPSADPATEATAPVEVIPEPEAKADEPEVVKDGPGTETATTEAAPEGGATTEEQIAPEGDTVAVADAPGEESAPQVIEEPVIQTRPIMEAPKTPTLPSLTSTDRDFTSTRYQSTTSPQFLNKPHQPANHSLDLDDRNMQSSINNWYKKVFSFADSLNWRPGWDHLEEFDYLVKSVEAPLSQVSLAPAQEWWAEKPKDPSIDWDKIDEAGAKYEEFWEWKSKIALTAICANFACREILGKTIFGLDEKMTKKLGLAMSVFTRDFGDDITATKFRHMTLKLLQESKSFGSSSRKQLVKLSQELANVLSPLTSFLPVKEPQTEEEKQQQAHYSPLTLALYEKVLFATHTLHDTIQKDFKYFALFHPVPGVEFDETTMEESTFQNLGAGKGAVALVARPGLVRLGLPRGGEPEDIVIVHKALVVREDALEEALKHFDTPVDEVPPAVPADMPVEPEEVKVE